MMSSRHSLPAASIMPLDKRVKHNVTGNIPMECFNTTIE